MIIALEKEDNKACRRWGKKDKNESGKRKVENPGFCETEVYYIMEASDLFQEGMMIIKMNNQFGFSFSHIVCASQSFLEDRSGEVTVVITGN